MRDFFQNWLGLRFRTTKKVPTWETIVRKFTYDYSWGTVPADCWFLTSGCDVQSDRVYWLVVGWAPARTPYIIEANEIMRLEEKESDDDEEVDDDEDSGIILASDLARLPAVVLNRSWPVNGKTIVSGRISLPVALAGVDSNHRTHEVHDLVRSVGSERLRCIRGDDAVSPKEKYRPSTIERNSRTGKPYPGGLLQWQIYRTLYQDSISDRLIAAADQPGTMRLPEDFLPRGRKIIRQICNVRKNDKGYYETINNALGKDQRDNLGYAEAMADMVLGDLGWKLKDWIAYFRDTQRKKKPRGQKKDVLER